MPEVNYFWDEIEDNVIEEYDENGNTIVEYTTEPTLYGSVLSQDRGGQVRHYHFDGQGNTTELTDENGNVTDTRKYSAFGEVTESTGTTEFPLQFGGQFGYYRNVVPTNTYVRARYLSYNGRWLSQDPVPFRDGPNSFVYVANDPFNLIDPSGLLIGPVEACTLVGLAVTLPPGVICLMLLDEAQRNGRIIHDPNNQAAHCFLNCCVTKLTLGIPVFTFGISCFEIFQGGNGLDDCLGDIFFNVVGYFEAIDSLYLSDPYNVGGNCAKRCNSYFRPKKPSQPQQPPEPYHPITPADLVEYERQLCQAWCRDETMRTFPGPSSEATDYYNNCVYRHCGAGDKRQ